MPNYPGFARPFRIFVGGFEIINYTTAVLQRDKRELTGQLQFGLFYEGLPTKAVLRMIRGGAPIQVYVGNRLAFTGTVDNRGSGNSKRKKENVNTLGRGQHSSIGQGKMAKGAGVSTHIGPNEFTITVRARGKAKRMIDSSHDHEDSCMPGATCRSGIERLTKPFNVELDWRAPDYDLDVATFRDGGLVFQEIDRIATDNGLWVYEDREGRLRVTNQAGPETGEALILGDNILEFETDQSDDEANREIIVKGRRRKKGVWGEEAVKRKVKLQDGWVKDYSRLVIQAYGDGTDEMLERRGKFEIDNRAQEAKQCRIQTFGVTQRSGEPWDVGMIHHVRVFTDDIDEPMECISLTYTVNNDRTCHTTLTMAPLPSGGIAGGLGALGGLSGMSSLAGQGGPPEADDGQYPKSWGPAEISNVTDEAANAATAAAMITPPPALPIPETIPEPPTDQINLNFREPFAINPGQS